MTVCHHHIRYCSCGAELALASSSAPAGLDDPEAPCPDCVHPNDWHGTEHGCVKGDCDRRYPAPAGLGDLVDAAYEYIAAVNAYLDPANQFTDSRRHAAEVAELHLSRALDRAATRPAEDADHE